MSRLDFVTFAIVAACVFALVFLVYKTMKMYTQPDVSTNPTEEVEDNADLYDDENTYTFDEEGEEITDDSEQPDAAENHSTNDADAGNENEQTTDNKNASSKDSSNDLSSNTSTKDNSNGVPSSYNNNTGKYMVLAGSFRQKANANAYAAQLQGMGYEDAEVSIFNRGTYATILVNRFDSQSDARALKRELSEKGVEAYVLKKRGN